MSETEHSFPNSLEVFCWPLLLSPFFPAYHQYYIIKNISSIWRSLLSAHLERTQAQGQRWTSHAQTRVRTAPAERAAGPWRVRSFQRGKIQPVLPAGSETCCLGDWSRHLTPVDTHARGNRDIFQECDNPTSWKGFQTPLATLVHLAIDLRVDSLKTSLSVIIAWASTRIL